MRHPELEGACEDVCQALGTPCLSHRQTKGNRDRKDCGNCLRADITSLADNCYDRGYADALKLLTGSAGFKNGSA
jgi:hypothetical protein